MLTIRLTRRGKKKQATFRVVVLDHFKAAKGKFVEDLGSYNPHLKDQKGLILKRDRLVYWLQKGVKLTTTTAALFKKLGLKEKLSVRKKKSWKKEAPKEGEKPVAQKASAVLVKAETSKSAVKPKEKKTSVKSSKTEAPTEKVPKKSALTKK